MSVQLGAHPMQEPADEHADYQSGLGRERTSVVTLTRTPSASPIIAPTSRKRLPPLVDLMPIPTIFVTPGAGGQGP